MSVKNIQFPVISDSKQGYFALTETTLETIKQNLVLMFATDERERVVNNQLGSKFRRFLFEPNVQNIVHKCEDEVHRIFNQFFPNLKLLNLNIEVLDDTATTKGAIKISISYTIKNLETIQDKVDLVIG